MSGIDPISYSKARRANAGLVDIANQLSNFSAPELNMLVKVNADEAILIRQVAPILGIETYTDGFKQVVTATATGTVIADPGGDATVTVTARDMTNSPKAISVALLLGDDASAIAWKIRIALAADVDASAFFDVSGSDIYVVLTAKVPADNDVTMNIAIAPGTATGVIAAPYSDNTVAGSKNEIVHPDILFFPRGWNGWKYWLGYTAYDHGSSDYENPCIAVSNDNVNWHVPDGLTNPIEPKPTEGFNSDVCLCMSLDNKTMYLFFKFTTTTSSICLRSSTDGVNWTPKVALFTNPFEDVSPTVIYDGEYKMWTTKPNDTPNNLYLRTAPAAIGPWSVPVLCTHNLPEDIEPWHQCVRKVGNQYYMLLHIAITRLFFGVSENGIDWTFGKDPIYQDAGYVYRSTMWPMISDKGLKFGIWWNRILDEGYKVAYSEMTFDRSEIKKNGDFDALAAKNLLSPWIFADTFNRADTISGLGTSETGQVWSGIGDNFGISGGKAYCTGTNNSRAIIDLGIADFYVEMKMVNTGTGYDGYLHFRYADEGNFWRFGHANGGYSFQKVVNYNASPDLLRWMDSDVVAGDRLGVECKGDVIKLYLNDVLIHTLTDSALNTATKIGINAFSPTTYFDNIIAKTV